jgi:hypothetical protein
MDVAYVSAMAALVGSVVGGLTSSGTTWLSQRAQARAGQIARQEEICGLKWRWEQRVPELDTPSIQRTVFVLPGSVTKNGEPRVLVLHVVGG